METKGLLTMSPQYPLRATFVSPWGGGGELYIVCWCVCACVFVVHPASAVYIHVVSAVYIHVVSAVYIHVVSAVYIHVRCYILPVPG